MATYEYLAKHDALADIALSMAGEVDLEEPKECKQCGEEKPLRDFFFPGQSLARVRTLCNPCRIKNRERMAARAAETAALKAEMAQYEAERQAAKEERARRIANGEHPLVVLGWTLVTKDADGNDS